MEHHYETDVGRLNICTVVRLCVYHFSLFWPPRTEGTFSCSFMAFLGILNAAKILYISKIQRNQPAKWPIDLIETAHIRLECPYRLNQKDWKPTFVPFAKARKRIETIYSQLTDQFMVMRNYAKVTTGLFTRIIGKVSALTILQYVNFINNKPIGRIKYAL